MIDESQENDFISDSDKDQENDLMNDSDEVNEDFLNSIHFFKRGIFLPDGSYEPMFDPEKDMARLIGEHMGMDAEMYFRAIMTSAFHNAREKVEADIFEATFDVDLARDYMEYALEADDYAPYYISEAIKLLKEVSERLDKYW